MLMSQPALYIHDIDFVVEDSVSMVITGDAEFSGTASVVNRGTMNLQGNWDNSVSGTLFAEDSGLVVFNGSSVQGISGSSEFYRLEVDNASGVSITGGQNTITHTLTLTNGTFTTNDSLYLRSDATRTARVAEVTGGSASGDFIVERYIPIASNNWRMLSAPVQGATLEQWDDDLITTGFTGSQYPSFPFISVFFYDETELGTAGTGFEAPSNITDAIPNAGGAWVYMGPSPVTVDVVGEIHTGTVNFPVTYTDDPGEGASEDGWNLVGNPYPSAIDWDASSGWTKTNLNDAIYIWDGELSQYRSYVNGVGSNGGTSTIASMQSFFVQANAASPVLSSTESVKYSGDAEFVDAPQTAVNLLRLGVKAWDYSDEAILRFHPRSTVGFDRQWDAFKTYSRDPYAPSIATAMPSGNYAINCVNTEELNEGIDVEVRVGWPGIHTIELREVPKLPDNYCLYLEDLVTSEHHPIDSGYSFSVFLDTGNTQLRFRIHAYKPFQYQIAPATCFGDSDGVSTLLPNGQGPWHLQWLNPEGLALFNDTIDTLTLLTGLMAGTHTVFINDPSGCGVSTQDITIPSHDSLWVKTALEPSFDDGRLGSIMIEPQGGVSPYQVHWTAPVFGTGAVLNSVPSDTYHLEVVDSVGCVRQHEVWLPEFSTSITGFSESSMPSLKVYPNPSTGIINIENRGKRLLSMQLQDMSGRMVFTQELSGSSSPISLSHLASGTYHLQLSSEQGIELSTTLLIQDP